ncbi:MAG: hypothetical protein GEV05_29265 [Betaproteobacteria bacterium]|nr:hypothetical protein [Betaproteobacteria bacterium]
MLDKRIIGTWRLKSTKAVDDDGAALLPPLGPAPNGVACFQADGRMYSVICDGRADVPSGEERLFISYTGNYTFDGETLSTRVDAASDPGRIGGDQVRKVRFESDGMVLAPPRRLFANVMQHQELFWERVAER